MTTDRPTPSGLLDRIGRHPYTTVWIAAVVTAVMMLLLLHQLTG